MNSNPVIDPFVTPNHRSERTWKPNRPLKLAGAVLLCWLAAIAAPSAATYDVQHTLRLRPGGNVVPRVTATYYAHAWVQERREDCAVFDVVPGAAAQPLGWGGYGTDRLRDRRGRIRNTGNGGGSTDANSATVAVGAGGLVATFTANAAGCRSTAIANSSFNINPIAAGGMVTGTIRAHGEATAVIRPPRRSAAYAFSMAMVEAQGGRQMRNGNIRWRKVVRDVVSGKASNRRQVDPIDYTVRDRVTGEEFTGTLYSVIIEATNSAAGGFLWESNVVNVNVQDLNFTVGFPSTNSSLKGMAHLEIRNGVVTTSTATGFYAGLLPPPGSAVPLSFPLPDEIDFDYDLGEFDGHDLDVALNFDGAGEAFDAGATDDVPDLTITVADPSVPSSGLILSWPETRQALMIEATSDFRMWKPFEVETKVSDGRVIAFVPTEGGSPQYFRLRLLDEPDTTPPTFEAHAECGSPKVTVHFSEPVDPISAMNPKGYSALGEVTGPLRIVNIVLQDPQTVCLLLDQPIAPGFPYVLLVQGVSDLAGNVVPPGSAATFGCLDQ